MTVKTYRQSYQVSKTGKELRQMQGLGDTEHKKDSEEKCQPTVSTEAKKCQLNTEIVNHIFYICQL